MDIKNTVKEGAEKGAKLWAAKKGLEWTGGLIKMAAVAGAGYLGYKYYKKNQATIDQKVKDVMP